MAHAMRDTAVCRNTKVFSAGVWYRRTVANVRLPQVRCQAVQHTVVVAIAAEKTSRAKSSNCFA